MTEKKQPNWPIFAMIAILAVFFVIPLFLVIVNLFRFDQFVFPTYVFEGVVGEVNAGLLLGIALLALPASLVVFIDRARKRGIDQKRALNLTLLLLVVFMILLTLVPLLARSAALGTVPLQGLVFFALFAGLPLITVAFIVVILLPGVIRRSNVSGQQQDEG